MRRARLVRKTVDFYRLKMTHFSFAALVLLLLAGCAIKQKTHSLAQPPENALTETPMPFSRLDLGELAPRWEPMILLPGKKQTEYQIVKKDQRHVLHAQAEAASSGLMQKLSVDPLAKPWLHWEWKIASLIRGADNSRSSTEDSPARIVLGFEGDKSKLSFSDQIFFETARLLTGRDLPYATLIYIWENKAPVDTLISNSRTDRIQKLVVASGPDGVGQWRQFERNIVEDYKRAFGEKPGRLIGVGVLTDTDNTGEKVQAWYGDIRLHEQRSNIN